MKRVRDSDFETRENCLQRQCLLDELMRLTLQWNRHARCDRCDITMYNGIVVFCEGDVIKIAKYVADLQAALKKPGSVLEDTLKRRIL